ncbi:alpha/beta hydrolase [Sporosarcina sp. 179-K 3D1 HS]
MTTFQHNGVNLYYEDTGDGQPILMLHGLTSNHESFRPEIEALKKDYRVIAPDARGHGASDRMPHFTLDDHIEDILALIDHLQLPSIRLLGVSMGSYIAQGVAVQIPERVKKLVLVVTKSHGSESSLVQLLDRHAEEMKGLSLPEKLIHASRYMYYNETAVNNRLHETAKHSRQLTVDEQKIASQALMGFDFRKELHRITAETLVISGTHDGLNPPAYGQETAELIPNATYMEFKLSGHAPNVEQPCLFMEIIEDFLK